MKKYIILLLILGCALPVLAKKRPEEAIITPMVQLEKRQYQTKIYNTEDKVIIMKSLLNVLQDEGYIIYNVNSLLGFIYGVKDYYTSDPNVDISKEFGFTKSRLTYNGIKIATMETNINITEYGNTIRIRTNFKRKLLNEYGNAQFIEDINEPEFYENFYKKVDNAINLQKTTKNQIKQENNIKQKTETIQTINKKDEVEIVEQETTPPTEEQIKETSQEDKIITQPQESEIEEKNLTPKELKKQEKALAKEQSRLLKEQEKQAKQEAKDLKELEEIQE